MRKKELKLVITFHTTAEAMAMEKACKTEGSEGRIIPVPRVISAGCGMAWCAPVESRQKLEKTMVDYGIVPQALTECLV